MNVMQLLKKRWSPRKFQDKTIEPEKIEKIFEAARWSASSYNEQPWRFYVGFKNDNTWKKIYESMVEFNQGWNEQTPVLIMGVAKKTFSHNEKENRHAKYDLGQAMAYLSVMATGEDLHVHQMAGFSPAKAKELFSIPDDFEATVVAALGYWEENKEEAEHRDNKRDRKPLTELLFGEKWNRSL